MKPFERGVARWVAALVLCLCAYGISRAQEEEFGKNKVQYTRFRWSYIQTDHFDIYFSDGGDYLAEFTATAAESAYASLSKSFRYQLVNRVPIIVYNSHNDFQQTNVVSEYLEEGIGGVTELFKNRVILPFEGGYAKFRHVIHHELSHAVLNDMFYGGSIQSIISNNITLQLPLWFNEGLAEYEALKWDTDSDMFLRDATVHEYLPPINQLYGYFAYRGGQSLWWYIAGKYGDQKVGEILNRIKSTRSVEAGFKGSLGLTMEELNERWQKEMKVIYWPDIAKREEPMDYSRRLTDTRKDGSFYNTSPAISPQGDKVAFISNRNEYFDVFIMNASDGTIIQKLVDGQTTNNFEELHLLTPGMSWSPDGKRIAISSKAGEQDAIFLIDVATGEQEQLSFNLSGIFSIDWSPKGDEIAFVGNKTSQSDIFVYNLKTKKLVNLTDDIYSDERPAWSPDGKKLFFSSDRGEVVSHDSTDIRFHDYSSYDIYSIDVATRNIERLTDWSRSNQGSPVVSPDGKKILFVSDRNGINNIYELNLVTNKWRPITNSLSGDYQLTLSHDGSKLVFSSLINGGFNLFLMRSPFDRDIKTAELEPTEYFKVLYPGAKEQEKAVAGKFAPAGRDSAVASSTAARDTAHPSAALAAAGTDSARLAAGHKPAGGADTAQVASAAKPASGDSTLYGKDVQIDFSNYVFKDAYSDAVPRDSTIQKMPRITENVDKEGHYKINKYKLNFTPDIVYGNAGYDTFYGVTGSTVMAFSDLMGDHQIIFSTNLLLDLKNSDFALQYYYLPNRVDFGIGGFHSARFIALLDQYGGSIYRFQTYGASLSAMYPFDRFDRLDMALNWFTISKENMEVTDAPSENLTVVVPQISYIHDTSLWGYTAPMLGSRYKFTLFGTPRFGLSGISFLNVTGDYRTYLRLGRGYSLAFRLAGGGSFGANPQKFIVGGTSNWINRTFTNDFIPLTNASDFIFLQAGVPLRGYDYNAQIGSKYGLFNFELRYPLFAFLQAGPLPIGLQSIAGVMFFDMGSAWDRGSQYVAFTHDENGNLVSRDLLMGMGTGARIFFLAFLVRFDIAWAWDVHNFSPPKYYFSLGTDF
jgi:Tol biopolymer transport system component